MEEFKELVEARLPNDPWLVRSAKRCSTDAFDWAEMRAEPSGVHTPRLGARFGLETGPNLSTLRSPLAF